MVSTTLFLVLLAQADPSPTTWWTSLGVFSATGAVCAGWIYYLISEGRAKDRLIREGLAREAAKDAQILELARETLPALADSHRISADMQRISSEYIELLRKQAR